MTDQSQPNGTPNDVQDALAVPEAALHKALVIAGFTGPQVWSSIDPKDDASMALFSRTMSQEPKPLMDAVNTEFPVEHVVIHRAEIGVNGGKDRIDTARMVLISPKGEMLDTVGMVPVKSMAMLMGIAGPPPYSPALVVRVDPVKCGNNFKSCSLTFIRREPAGKKTATR